MVGGDTRVGMRMQRTPDDPDASRTDEALRCTSEDSGAAARFVRLARVPTAARFVRLARVPTAARFVRRTRIGNMRRGAERRRGRPGERRRGRLGEPPTTLLRTLLLLSGAPNGRPRTEGRSQHRRARRLHLPLRQRPAAASAYPLERQLDGPSAQGSAQGCRGRSAATKLDGESQRLQGVHAQRPKVVVTPEETAQANGEARRAIALCTHRRDVAERRAYLWGKAPW